jgi:hypothetical protein
METNSMTEIWAELIQRSLEPPKTIAETIDRLLTVLDDEHKIVIAAMQEKDLIDLHFSLGVAIRNAFGFWDPGSPLLTSCNAISPDDVSDQVILELWKRLNQKLGPLTWENTLTH